MNEFRVAAKKQDCDALLTFGIDRSPCVCICKVRSDSTLEAVAVKSF